MVTVWHKAHLFDPTRAAASTWIFTIARNKRILQNQKNYKKRVHKAPIDELFKDDTHTYSMDEVGVANDPLNMYINLYVDYCSERLFELFPKKHDAAVADAILELFRKREHIDVFNKKALYIYIREMIDVKTPKITKIANQLYAIFKSNYIFYLENGYVEFE